MESLSVPLPPHFVKPLLGRKGKNISKLRKHFCLDYVHINDNDVLVLIGNKNNLTNAQAEVNRQLTTYNASRPLKWKIPRRVYIICKFDFPIFLRPYKTRYILTKAAPCAKPFGHPFQNLLTNVGRNTLVEGDISHIKCKEVIQSWYHTLTDHERDTLIISAEIGKITFPYQTQRYCESSHCYIGRIMPLSTMDLQLGVLAFVCLQSKLQVHGFIKKQSLFCRRFCVKTKVRKHFEVSMETENINTIIYDWDRLLSIPVCHVGEQNDYRVLVQTQKQMTWDSCTSDNQKIMLFLQSLFPNLSTKTTSLAINRVHTCHIRIYQRDDDFVKFSHRIEDDTYSVSVYTQKKTCILDRIAHVSKLAEFVKDL